MILLAAEPSLLDRVGDLAPVLAAVATGLFGLVFLFVGQRLGRTKDSEAWRRDRRLDAYARCLNAAHHTWEALGALRSNAEATAARWDELIAELRAQASAVGAIVSEIEIIGPPDVAQAGLTMQRTLESLSTVVSGWIQEPYSERWNRRLDSVPEGEVAQKALAAFTTAAGAALS